MSAILPPAERLWYKHPIDLVVFTTPLGAARVAGIVRALNDLPVLDTAWPCQQRSPHM